MNKTVKLVVALVVVVVAAGAFVMLNSKDNKKADTTTSSSSPSSSSAASNGTPASSAAVAATITYDGSTFKSSTSTIKVGDSVKVTNASQDQLNFDSDPHPVHTDEPELNVGDIDPGESKTFTITKKGMWGYHNHLDSSQHGEITVE
jgi:plastocyanin